jgi:hypothetical protein
MSLTEHFYVTAVEAVFESILQCALLLKEVFNR